MIIERIKKKSVEGTVYHMDGTTSRRTFHSFTEVQTQVEGYVEQLEWKGEMYLVDEEGNLKNKKINPHAMKLIGLPIVGTIVKLDEDLELLHYETLH